MGSYSFPDAALADLDEICASLSEINSKSLCLPIFPL